MFYNAYKNKRVLITGHTGFKGSWLTQWLLSLGANVAGFSLDVPTSPAHYEILKLSDHIDDLRGDIRDFVQTKAVFQKFQPEAVFHLAAQPIVRKSYDDPKLTFDTNLGGMVNVLEAIRQTPSVRAAVLITSDKCYENVEWEFGYREDDRLGGKDPYSASKACAEIAFSAYVRSYFTQKDAPLLVTSRAGNVIGGGDWANDRIVPDCIKAWSQGKVMSCRNPRATRPWQHVLEPLSGYVQLGALLLNGKRGLAGNSYNFGPPADVNYPVSRLIDCMKEVWSKGEWKNEQSNADEGNAEASLLKLCCDKALSRVNWKPTLTFDETVRMTAEWYLRYYTEEVDVARFTCDQIKNYELLAVQRKLSWTLED